MARAARAAGFGYLVIIVSGIFAHFFIRAGLIVPGDAAVTAGNIADSESLFRLGMVLDFVMVACDVVVALALYMLLRPVSKGLSLLAAWFRLVQATVNGINLVNLFLVLSLVSGAGYIAAFGRDQLNALSMLFLNGHAYGILVGQVFFGIHCLVIGYLVYRSGYIPRILGILLLFASAGYLTESFGNLLSPGHADLFSYLVAVPAIIAELSLCLWLLFRGGRISDIGGTGN
jgi:hypothetical protein